MQVTSLPVAYPSYCAIYSAPRPVESASSPDLARAAFAPASAANDAQGAKGASAEQEQDRQGEASQSASDAGPAGEEKRTARQEQVLRLEIAELANRDQEVRTHEQAHAAVGGVHAGAPTYTYTRGPDGKRYATGGEVSIDVGAVANDPQATLSKMEIVIRAALAPAEPSAQDRRVAAQAQAQMAVARAELAALRREEAQSPADDARDEVSEKSDDPSVTPSTSSERLAPIGIELYSRNYAGDNGASALDLRA